MKANTTHKLLSFETMIEQRPRFPSRLNIYWNDSLHLYQFNVIIYTNHTGQIGYPLLSQLGQWPILCFVKTILNKSIVWWCLPLRTCSSLVNSIPWHIGISLVGLIQIWEADFGTAGALSHSDASDFKRWKIIQSKKVKPQSQTPLDNYNGSKSMNLVIQDFSWSQRHCLDSTEKAAYGKRDL